MTEAQMRETLSAAFLAAWRAEDPSIPVVLEDERRPSVDNFALLTIVATTSTQMTQGAPGTRRVQRNAWAQVKIWATAGDGMTAMSARLVDRTRRLLEMVDIPSAVAGDEPITTFACMAPIVTTDGRWQTTVVRIPLWYVETK